MVELSRQRHRTEVDGCLVQTHQDQLDQAVALIGLSKGEIKLCYPRSPKGWQGIPYQEFAVIDQGCFKPGYVDAQAPTAVLSVILALGQDQYIGVQQISQRLWEKDVIRRKYLPASPPLFEQASLFPIKVANSFRASQEGISCLLNLVRSPFDYKMVPIIFWETDDFDIVHQGLMNECTAICLGSDNRLISLVGAGQSGDSPVWLTIINPQVNLESFGVPSVPEWHLVQEYMPIPFRLINPYNLAKADSYHFWLVQEDSNPWEPTTIGERPGN